MTEVASEVTLAAPPPPVAVEETRGDELPTLPSGGLHDLSLLSEPKALEESVAGTKLGRPAASHANVVVEIPSDDEADTVAEPAVSPRELVVVRSEAGPSGGSSEGDLEWPYPEDPSKVRAAEAATAWAEGQRAAERATAVEQGLEAAKVCQEETKAGLRTSLANTKAALQEALAALESEKAALESAQKALEAEQRARSEADREVLALWDQPVFELVAPLAELGEKVKALERDLEMTKANFSRNVEELAKSHEERRALEGELSQIRNTAQLVVSEVFGSVPSTSAPAVQLAEVPYVAKDLVRTGLFYGASGVLTSVATYHPNLDFATICGGYAEGMSMEDIQSIGESLLPHARSMSEQVSVKWVMDAATLRA
ncbi:uncharacterized protein [Miscanthus floridulus]|uniref:uncharacterized protein n=1 Tax=Miscanthus floridulus TaxID=154761 RepID=UPI00345A07A6